MMSGGMRGDVMVCKCRMPRCSIVAAAAETQVRRDERRRRRLGLAASPSTNKPDIKFRQLLDLLQLLSMLTKDYRGI